MSNLFGNEPSNLFLADLQFLPIVLNIAMVACAFNLLCFVYRVIKGPTLSDRAIALDACGITVMCLIAIYSLKQGTDLYMSSVLVIAILGFISLVAEGKFIQSGNIADNSNISITFDKTRQTDDDLKRLARESKQAAHDVYKARKDATAKAASDSENKEE